MTLHSFLIESEMDKDGLIWDVLGYLSAPSRLLCRDRVMLDRNPGMWTAQVMQPKGAIYSHCAWHPLVVVCVLALFVECSGANSSLQSLCRPEWHCLWNVTQE